MKQYDLIKQLSKKELRIQLFLSQGLFLLLAIVLSFFLFDSFFDWMTLFKWNIKEIFIFGFLSAVIVVLMELAIVYLTPKTWWDDGGINELIFKNQPLSFIFVFTLTVAICEEFLFRGVIQTTFGYTFASILFAVVHIRYLKKPLLFFAVLLLSFYIGWVYKHTGNLIAPIVMHFFIDFLLGLVIRLKK
ncbi:CPBP family intramembrane glutamic endopeptidase [Oceanobacillus sp. CFH 90083]|uniref:CPBP family intramembrane glutamic endopeptidase n=1 Tax=Oceanobacillus sp. CFH 90083 TaxID=2592336 RepID=UPI00128B534A|nr:CPBP family intramembrane glutamic endopeptidase [Oceanobacillus sp. CFH 90083]